MGSPRVSLAKIHINTQREPQGSDFTVVSDGWAPGKAIGYGAVLVDGEGPFAEVSSRFVADAPHAWAAEGMGKVVGLQTPAPGHGAP